jgi:hypothetical protein
MVALNWTQFEKRLRPNLKTFWQMVINNRRFVLEKAVKDWDGTTKLTEGIQLTGIVYQTKKMERGREIKDDREFFCQNYSSADDFADAVMHRLPLKNLDGKKLKLILYDETTYVPFGALFKSSDFGGGSTSLDLGQLKWGHLGFFAERCNFRLLPPGKQIELYWLNDFNDLVTREREKLMKSGEDVCLDFEIAGVTVHNVIGAMGAPDASKDPKADIVFVTCKDGCLEYTGFASLKDGTDVKHFQQWGGLSAFKDHEEVKQFAEDLKQLYPQGISAAGGGVNVGREIEDRKMKIEAIYGPSYRRGHYNSESVQFVIQGTQQRIQKQGNVYKLITGSTHHYSDSVAHQNELMTGNTRPVFMARADNNRNDLGVPKTRIFIYSAGGRTNWNWI